jgi:uncharacterized membrane protein
MHRRIHIDPWVAAALLCALALRLFRFDAAALWFDEIDTVVWATLSPEQFSQSVLQRRSFGNDPRNNPLYFLIVNAWTEVVGLSPWLLRLPSVGFSMVTVALTASLGHALAGVHAARWAAWLAALSPFLIHHAQEARMYPLLSALAAASVLLLVRYLGGTSARLGWMFALVNIALLLTHYYSVFLIGAELLVLLYLRPAPTRSWALAWMGCAAAMALLCFIALFLTSQSSGEIYKTGLWALPGVLWAMVAGYGLLPSAEQLHETGLAAIQPYLPFALIGAVPAAILSISGVLALTWRTRGVVMVLLASILLGPFLVSAIFPKVSLNPRYFAAGAPLLLTVLSAGMPALKAGWWHKAAAIVLIGLMGVGTAIGLGQPGQKREDVFAAGAWLDQNVAPEEEILMTSDEMAWLASYHWPKRNILVYPMSKVVVTPENVAAVTEGLPVDGKRRLIYVFGRSWVSDPTHALERSITARFRSCGGTEVRGIRIYCLLNPASDYPPEPTADTD